MTKFQKQNDYSDEDLKKAVRLYMDLYAKHQGQVPLSVKKIADQFGVPESTLYGRISRARKKYDEDIVARMIITPSEESQESGEGENERAGTANLPEKGKNSNLLQHLAEEQRKKAILTLRKEYGSFQQDSLEVKLQLLEAIKQSVSYIEDAKKLIDKLNDAEMDLAMLIEAGDEVAKQLSKDMKVLSKTLYVYCSAKSLRDLAVAQREVEVLIANQFGLPYGTASERAKVLEIESKVKLNNAKAEGGDNIGFNYEDLISGN